MPVLEFKTFTAFCRALCHLWCKKLEIPLNAKPTTFVAMVPKIVVKNLFFLLVRVGSINPISFCKSS